MNHLPIHSLSPEEQQNALRQLYVLMGKQVQSYHKKHHMGSNSSVPMELAQELMESIEYTLSQVGGVYAHRNIEEALQLGQGVLETKLEQAKALLKLITGTASDWQTECRWSALRYLRHYLDRYDHLHLAHRGAEDLFYPILISTPEGIRGIDRCLFYLRILWIENQIMDGFPKEQLEALWDRMPAAALNQCEQLLVNAMGKALIGADPRTILFTPEEHILLIGALAEASPEQLNAAAEKLAAKLQLKDENAAGYAKAVTALFQHWTGRNAFRINTEQIFL